MKTSWESRHCSRYAENAKMIAILIKAYQDTGNERFLAQAAKLAKEK